MQPTAPALPPPPKVPPVQVGVGFDQTGEPRIQLRQGEHQTGLRLAGAKRLAAALEHRHGQWMAEEGQKLTPEQRAAIIIPVGIDGQPLAQVSAADMRGFWEMLRTTSENLEAAAVAYRTALIGCPLQNPNDARAHAANRAMQVYQELMAMAGGGPRQ